VKFGGELRGKGRKGTIVAGLKRIGRRGCWLSSVVYCLLSFAFSCCLLSPVVASPVVCLLLLFGLSSFLLKNTTHLDLYTTLHSVRTVASSFSPSLRSALALVFSIPNTGDYGREPAALREELHTFTLCDKSSTARSVRLFVCLKCISGASLKQRGDGRANDNKLRPKRWVYVTHVADS